MIAKTFALLYEWCVGKNIMCVSRIFQFDGWLMPFSFMYNFFPFFFYHHFGHTDSRMRKKIFVLTIVIYHMVYGARGHITRNNLLLTKNNLFSAYFLSFFGGIFNVFNLTCELNHIWIQWKIISILFCL